MKSLLRLLHCIWDLGIQTGWRYWKLQNECIKNPRIALDLAEWLHDSSWEEPNLTNQVAMRDFASKVRHHYFQHTSKRS